MARKTNRSKFGIVSHAPSVFDKLPPELCQHIFSFVCLDDGYTGRSLSLVSKYISEASKPVQFQSLVVRNLAQVEALASVLEKVPQHHRRVLHLFVLCNFHQMYTRAAATNYGDGKDKSRTLSPSPSRRIISALSRLRLHPRPHRPSQTTRDPFVRMSVRGGTSSCTTIEERMRLALVRILHAVAHSLQILTICVQTPRANVTLHGLPSLPRLRELMITYGCEYYPRVPTRVLDTLQPLPALRRLNLIRFESGYGPLDLVRQVERLAPSLTHVRLPSVVVDWNRWLDMDANIPAAGNRLRPHLPSTVQKIFIRPPPPPPFGTARKYYEKMLGECRALAMWNDRVILERPDQVLWDFDVKELEREWLDRINGGDGCWGADNAMVLY